MTTTLSTVKIKAHFSELLERVRSRGERLIVLRRGRPVAAVVGIEDLRRLEQLDGVESRTGLGERHPVMRAFGAWELPDELEGLFGEIQANRMTSSLRDAEF